MKKVLKLVSLILVLSLTIFAFAACGAKPTVEKDVGSEEPVQDSRSDKEVKSSDEVIKISAIGLEDPITMVKNFDPLCKYLSNEIGKEVKFVPSATYEDAVNKLKDGSIDMAHLGPVTYVQAHDGFGGEPLVKALEGGETEYSSVIFVRNDSSIKDVTELKGKKVAFGDKDSMSSNCAPKYFMFNKGVKESDLAAAVNHTSQDTVISNVLSKDFDAGTVKESIFEKNKDKGIRIIGKQEHIPTFPMTVRKEVDSKVKEDLKKALLKLTDTEILKAVDKKYTGFTEGSDADYAWVRDAMNKLGIK